MFSRTDERSKLLNEALTAGEKREEKANEQEDPEPDPEQDVFGWVQWSRRKTQRLEQMTAGCVHTASGYVVVGVDGEPLRAHGKPSKRHQAPARLSEAGAKTPPLFSGDNP